MIRIDLSVVAAVSLRALVVLAAICRDVALLVVVGMTRLLRTVLCVPLLTHTRTNFSITVIRRIELVEKVAHTIGTSPPPLPPQPVSTSTHQRQVVRCWSTRRQDQIGRISLAHRESVDSTWKIITTNITTYAHAFNVADYCEAYIYTCSKNYNGARNEKTA